MNMTNHQASLFATAQTNYTNDDWYTPKWIFDALNLQFDIDVSSPPGGIPWIPAKNHYTIQDDGLAQPWHGLVWMNPPFSKLTPWADKYIEHGNGIALTPFCKSKWLDRMWNANTIMINLPSDLKFQKPNGKSFSMAYPAVLWAMGDQAQNALKKLGKTR